MRTAHLIPPQSVKLASIQTSPKGNLQYPPYYGLSSSVALKVGPAVKKIYENPNNGLLSLEMSFNTTTDRKKSKRRKNKSPNKGDSP